jgi:SNF2 family DNA or RNA helicase
MSVELYPHQQEDLEAMRKHRSFALWHEVGAGKTFPIASRVMEILDERPGSTAIVITEPALLRQMDGDFRKVRADVEPAILSGSVSKRDRPWILKDPPQVLICNYEFFPKIAAWAEAHAKRGHVSVLWCDEAQRLKGFRGIRSKHGKRSKDIQRVAALVPYRFASSGSPVVNPNSPDIWGIYHFLDPAIFGPTLWKFEGEFFYDVMQGSGQRFKKLRLKESMKEEMSRRMFLLSRRILKSDLPIEFPERTVIRYEVDMPPETSRVYRDLENTAITEVAGQVVTRTMVLARLMALQQIASGFLIEHDETTRDRRIIQLNSSHKDRAVEHILESIGNDASCIIWAVFTHEIDHLCRLVGDIRGERPARFDGQSKGQGRDEDLDRFQSGRVRTLIAHPQAAGAGLNLQIAGHTIRYSRSYRLMDFIQTRGRNQRVSKEQFHTHITDHEIICHASTDAKIAEALDKKMDLSSDITLDFLGAQERNNGILGLDADRVPGSSAMALPGLGIEE